MPLHHSSFLTTDCNKDHQATLLEKGTYSLALFTNLKQKLQFCKHFVTVCKNSWDIALFAHYDTPTSSEYAENFASMYLLNPWTIAKKIQQNTRGHTQTFGTG